MVVEIEITTVLLGTAAAVALVLYARAREHPKNAASVVATRPATTYIPEAQAVSEPKTEAAPTQAEPAPEPTPAPSPAPAIYETVQPETSPALPPAPAAGGSSAATFGASETPYRYRRRPVPSISSAGRTVHRRERKR